MQDELFAVIAQIHGLPLVILPIVTIKHSDEARNSVGSVLCKAMEDLLIMPCYTVLGHKTAVDHGLFRAVKLRKLLKRFDLSRFTVDLKGGINRKALSFGRIRFCTEFLSNQILSLREGTNPIPLDIHTVAGLTLVLKIYFFGCFVPCFTYIYFAPFIVLPMPKSISRQTIERAFRCVVIG